MVEQFVGTWKLVSSVNFDEYMKEVGECRYFWWIMWKLGFRSSLKSLDSGTTHEQPGKDKEKEPDKLMSEPPLQVSANYFIILFLYWGMSFASRQVGNLSKPKLVVSMADDGFVTMKAESSLKTAEVKFKLDEECDETTADGRKAKVGCCNSWELICFTSSPHHTFYFIFILKSVFKLENGKLVQTQSWDGKTTRLEREIQDGELRAVSKC